MTSKYKKVKGKMTGLLVPHVSRFWKQRDSADGSSASFGIP
jgi:hypothetical protein